MSAPPQASLAEPPYRVQQGGVKKSVVVCNPTLTIRHFQAEKRGPEEEQVTPLCERNAPFTMEQLQVAWAAVAQMVFSEPMLHSTILKNLPEELVGSQFVITIDTPSQRDQLNDWKPKILDLLRDKLDNTQTNFEVRLRDISDAPRYRSRQELFNAMLERYPDLVQFKDLFGLEMA